MGKYVVTSGQNLYDVALHIYGSIEGIVDLMINNPGLSLCDVLKNGDEFEYTDDYIINQDVVAHNRIHRIIPSNSERNVYPKYPVDERICEIHLSNNRTSVEFFLNGTCDLEIDWGDNSKLEFVSLIDDHKSLTHVFDSLCTGIRKIRIYGSGAFREIYWSKLDPLAVYLNKPLTAEVLFAENFSCSLDSLSLINNPHTIKLNNSKIESLLPLLSLWNLRILDLTNAKISKIVLDEYLIALVNNYGMRRYMLMHLTIEPSGDYKEPHKDENNRYVITNGMEAIWVILHEPAWNEAGDWTFIINNKLYSYNHG